MHVFTRQTEMGVTMSTTDRRFNRRKLFSGAAAMAGGAAALELATTGCSSKSAEAAAPGTSIVASDKNAVADTAAGKVRGFTRNGIHTFKGIP
jgi:para-nitrobenzyl esterase